LAGGGGEEGRRGEGEFGLVYRKAGEFSRVFFERLVVIPETKGGSYSRYAGLRFQYVFRESL
jgi:hypothetical protein